MLCVGEGENSLVDLANCLAEEKIFQTLLICGLDCLMEVLKKFNNKTCRYRQTSSYY